MEMKIIIISNLNIYKLNWYQKLIQLKVLYSNASGCNIYSIIPILKEILNHSKFKSSIGVNSSSWLINVKDITYSSETLDDYIRGLKLANKSQHEEIIESFKKLSFTLHSIHRNHLMLCKNLFHYEFLNGLIEFTISPFQIESINTTCLLLNSKIKEWKKLIDSFSPRIRLLRNKGISSLYSLLQDFLEVSKKENKKDILDIVLFFESSTATIKL
ncbi:hypothetical protein ACTFIW_006403 [Dictyostelium discoideum]